MSCGRRRLILVALLALFGILLPFVGNFSRQRLGEGSAGEGPGTATGGGDGQEDVQISVKEEEKEVKAEDAGERQETDPIEEIKPIHIPFKQKPGEWEKKGISFSASGEPKSGTTWLGRVVVELSLKLCGNPRNSWCKMGGLTVIDKPPAPRYDFEMLNADTGWLYLHFKGIEKHQIPGFGAEGGCSGGSIVHGNTFGRPFPCDGMEKPTRAALEACLPDKSPKCVPFLPPLDPARRRAAVVIRDPRNVVISEHRMRSTVYHENVGPLQPFVRYRLERILAWVNQRWVWHTTGLKDISHVMFYEDLKADPVHLIELASFMGLECTAEEANSIWRVDTNANPPGDWTTYGLSHETLEWMNTTMASLLPEAVLDRYGLTPIYD